MGLGVAAFAGEVVSGYMAKRNRKRRRRRVEEETGASSTADSGAASFQERVSKWKFLQINFIRREYVGISLEEFRKYKGSVGPTNEYEAM